MDLGTADDLADEAISLYQRYLADGCSPSDAKLHAEHDVQQTFRLVGRVPDTEHDALRDRLVLLTVHAHDLKIERGRLAGRMADPTDPIDDGQFNRLNDLVSANTLRTNENWEAVHETVERLHAVAEANADA